MAGTKVLYVRIPERVHLETVRISEERSVTLSALVSRALVFYLTTNFETNFEGVGLP